MGDYLSLILVALVLVLLIRYSPKAFSDSRTMHDAVGYAVARYCVTEESRKGMEKTPGTALITLFDGAHTGYVFNISISTEGVLLRKPLVWHSVGQPKEFFFPWKALRSPKPRKLSRSWAFFHGRDKMQVDVKGTDICLVIDPPTFEKHFASHFA